MIVPARVERWFGEANFHHAEFGDLRRLAQLKEQQGTTISLVLPTLNEEETIGPIVRRAIRELCATFGVFLRVGNAGREIGHAKHHTLICHYPRRRAIQ